MRLGQTKIESLRDAGRTSLANCGREPRHVRASGTADWADLVHPRHPYSNLDDLAERLRCARLPDQTPLKPSYSDAVGRGSIWRQA
jgi:hypothetical protein